MPLMAPFLRKPDIASSNTIVSMNLEDQSQDYPGNEVNNIRIDGEVDA